MRRTGRFPIVAAIVVAALLSVTASTAVAQSVSQVRAGSEVAVANNGECRPDTDVALFFEGAGVAEVQVGSAVSDASGSFAASVVIPAEASVGAAAILVDCGLDSAVLTYDLEVIGGGFSLGSLIGPVLVGLAVIAIIGLVAMLRKRRIHGDDSDSTDHQDDVDTIEPVRAGIGDRDLPAPVAGAETDAAAFEPGRDGAGLTAAAGSGPEVGQAPQAPVWQPPGAAAPAPPAPVAAVAASAPLAPPAPVAVQEGPDADHDDGGIDDGADYWFWEAATSAGPRRRVACMTETTFHLHEVSVDAFQPMLDRLVEVGPDAALAQAFVRIPVAAVDRVVREGTVVHIEGRSANGPRRQTIDLADGADGVIDMLARRLPIVDASPMQESVR